MKVDLARVEPTRMLHATIKFGPGSERAAHAGKTVAPTQGSGGGEPPYVPWSVPFFVSSKSGDFKSD